MYNKTKYGLTLGAGITSIVYGAIEIILSIISITTIGQVLKSNAQLSAVSSAIMYAALVISILLCSTIIILGAFLCRKPKANNSGFNYYKGLKIALLVICAILFILVIVATNGLIIILDLFALAAIIGLLIAALCIKDKETIVMETATTETPENIANEQDLQTMKDLGIITEEEIEQNKKISQIDDLKKRGVITEEQANEATKKIKNKN